MGRTVPWRQWVPGVLQASTCYSSGSADGSSLVTKAFNNEVESCFLFFFFAASFKECQRKELRQFLKPLF